MSTRRTEFKFIIVLLKMLAFNAASSAFAIKQNDALFVFFDNVKNAQKKKNIFYDAIEPLIQDVITILNNTKSINVDDFENAFVMSSFKISSALLSVRMTISNSIFDFSSILDRLHAYWYIQWKNSKEEYSDVK